MEIYFSFFLASLFLAAALAIFLPGEGWKGVLAKDLLLVFLLLVFSFFLLLLLLDTGQVLLLFPLLILSSFAFSLLLALREEYISFLQSEREEFFALTQEKTSPGFYSFLANK